MSHAVNILILCLYVTLFSTAKAQHVEPHPKGCIDNEVYISSQDWWQTTPDETGQDSLQGNDFGHLHTELCFPHKEIISGEMTLDVTSIMHNNPGEFYKLVIQLWQSELPDMTPESDSSSNPLTCGEGSAIACKKFNPPRTLDTCESSGGKLMTETTCKWVDTLTFDTRFFPNDGWQQFRISGKIHQDDGTKMRTSTGLHAYIKNDNPIQHINVNPDRLEGRGWYTDAGYAVSNVKDILSEPVSGVWSPWVEMKQGSGGIPITHHRVALDASIHTGNPGIEILDAPGSYKGRISIDTTTLTNGWHTLFLRTSQFEPISGSTNSSVFVLFFEVLNTNQATCDSIHIKPAMADAYVRDSKAYGDNNFGEDSDLIVKGSRSKKYTRRSFLRFDLNGFDANTIDSATFKTSIRYHQSPGVSVPLKLFLVTDDSWGEDTLTWNNQPFFNQLIGTVNVLDIGPIEFDLTEFVATELLVDNMLSFVLLDDSGINRMLKLNSRDAENHPPSLELITTTDECPLLDSSIDQN